MSIVFLATVDVKIQQDFSALLGSQSIATQVLSSIQAVWHSYRDVKFWGIPSNPCTSFVWVQHIEFNPVSRNKLCKWTLGNKKSQSIFGRATSPPLKAQNALARCVCHYLYYAHCRRVQSLSRRYATSILHRPRVLDGHVTTAYIPHWHSVAW